MSGRHREQAWLPQGFWVAYKSAAKRRSNVGAGLLAKAVWQSMKVLNVRPPSRASSAPTGFWVAYKSAAKRRSNVGASLLAKAVWQSMKRLNVRPPSRASSAPTGFWVAYKSAAKRRSNVGASSLAIAVGRYWPFTSSTRHGPPARAGSRCRPRPRSGTPRWRGWRRFLRGWRRP